MKINTLAAISAVYFLALGAVNAQDMHSSSNAVSIENEANTTTGWNGNAAIASDTSDVYHGQYAFRISMQNNGREANYSFNASVGEIYNITIWAKTTPNSNNPAFANWTGFQGFSTRVINSAIWTSYNFTVTATSASPVIRIYAGPIGSPPSSDLLIDAVQIISQTPPDNTPPTAPQNLSASGISSNSLSLTWDASTDNVAVTGYRIYQDNLLINSVAGNQTNFAVTNLQPETSYSFQVRAIDAMQNISAADDTLLIATLPVIPDSIAPTAPQNLASSNITSGGFLLSWSPATDNVGVSGYILYNDSTSYAIIQDSSLTSYTVTGLSPETTYSFSMEAFDAAGNNSLRSDSIQVTTLQQGASLVFTSDNANLPNVNWQANNLFSAGSVGIGTSPNSNYRLSVNGSVRTKEVIVESGWSDFVFESGYHLPTLEEVEKYILENGHLIDIPPASHVYENGIGLARMTTLLLQKIEEMTLYIIAADKKIKELESHIYNTPDMY